MNIKRVPADVQLLVDVLVTAVVAPVEGHIGKCLETCYVILQGQIVVVVPLVVSPRLAGGHQAQPFSLRLQGFDADDSIHLGIVACTRSSNDVHTLHVR